MVYIIGMEALKKSADEMLQKKPPKLLKQLISELDYLDETDLEIISQALLMSINLEELVSHTSFIRWLLRVF